MQQKRLTKGQVALLICLLFTWVLLFLELPLESATWIGLLLIPYIAPTLAAAFYTRKKNWGMICFYNVFFGLTGIGWIICFIWASKPDSGDVRPSPTLTAMRAKLRAAQDGDIRAAIMRAERTGFPEDFEAVNAKIAEYQAEYGASPHVIKELEAQVLKEK